MKMLISVIFGIAIALGFIYFVFKIFPIGIAIAIFGAILATNSAHARDKTTYYLGSLGGWIFFVGVVVAFIFNGWINGIAAIILGFLGYHYGKK